MIQLIIEKKTIYGTPRVYPKCNTSQHFADLLCVKTFNDRQIEYIKKLGYSFIQLKEEL